MNKDNLKKQYFQSKEELDILRDDITLKKWKILSKAYKTGKKIWGTRFTRQRLSYDMDIPVTTVLRCLSLDKANKRTWRLIRAKKISVFKVAQICQSKNNAFQGKIIDMVIENNLSTYQITSLRVNDISDISKEKHRLATENGYSRKSSAYRDISNWIDRGTMFMLMDEKHLPENKREDVNDKLKKLYKNIGRRLQ